MPCITFFLRALKIRNSQNLIKLLKDDKGNESCNPNAMAKTMLTYVSQIIGQEELISKDVLDAQNKILHSVNRGISQAIDTLFLDQFISKDERKRALFAMGLEKSLRWDGITVNFYRDFWQQLKEPTFLIAYRAF